MCRSCAATTSVSTGRHTARSTARPKRLPMTPRTPRNCPYPRRARCMSAGRGGLPNALPAISASPAPRMAATSAHRARCIATSVSPDTASCASIWTATDASGWCGSTAASASTTLPTRARRCMPATRMMAAGSSSPSTNWSTTAASAAAWRSPNAPMAACCCSGASCSSRASVLTRYCHWAASGQASCAAPPSTAGKWMPARTTARPWPKTARAGCMRYGSARTVNRGRCSMANWPTARCSASAASVARAPDTAQWPASASA